MSKAARFQLAICVILMDILLFAIPVTAFVVGYVLIFRPTWFAKLFVLVYKDRRNE